MSLIWPLLLGLALAGQIRAERAPPPMLLSGDEVVQVLPGEEGIALLVRDGRRWRVDRVRDGRIVGGQAFDLPAGTSPRLTPRGTVWWPGAPPQELSPTGVVACEACAVEASMPRAETRDEGVLWTWSADGSCCGEAVTRCPTGGAVAPGPDGGWMLLDACGGVLRWERAWRASGTLDGVELPQGDLWALGGGVQPWWWASATADEGLLVAVDADSLPPWRWAQVTMPLGAAIELPQVQVEAPVEPAAVVRVRLAGAEEVEQGAASATHAVLAGRVRVDGVSRPAVWVVALP
jgi:hypothetical protein